MSNHFIPYGRQIVSDEDIDAVVAALRSDWLTTGPAVDTFQEAMAGFVGAAHGVAVSNGTAALHLAMLAAEVGPGDEVIVTTMTFAASANCARYVGADVVFADVRPDTLTIDVDHLASLITERTKAIVAVDYAGVPCDLDELMSLAHRHGLTVVEDACHAPGAVYKNRRVGSIAHMSTFSFHPVKHLTTGEGGMITTNDGHLAARLMKLRNHGIATEWRSREEAGTWEYDMVELGMNYRLPDVLCALGTAQLTHLPEWVEKRRSIAERYNRLFDGMGGIQTPAEPDDRQASWHLYPIRLTGENVALRRAEMFAHLRAHAIGVNVHYRPVHLHPYYVGLGYPAGLCPVAEHEYQGLLSLPMWPGLNDTDQDRVVELIARGPIQDVAGHAP